MNRGREDWAFNIALGTKGYCGVRVDYPGYLYRREGQNRTLHNTNPAWRERFLTQLWGLFPRIYAGDRPIMCCKGSKRMGSTPSARRATNARRSVNMAKMNIGGVVEDVITSEEFTLDKAREVLKIALVEKIQLKKIF